MNTRSLRKIFLNDRFVMVIIAVNALTIFIQEAGIINWFVNSIDTLCTVFFLCEMIVKHIEWGARKYWSSGWNRLDGILVIISIPSLLEYVFPSLSFNTSFLLAFRMLRVFRFFRVFHLFPNFEKIMSNVKLAVKQSLSIFCGLFVLIVIFSLVNCALFKGVAPEYFGTPMISMFSVFQICTVEGWYEIPKSIAHDMPTIVGHLIRIYFVGILIILGLVGMSIVNSIFVDAMISDNNDDVLLKLDNLEKKIDELKREK